MSVCVRACEMQVAKAMFPLNLYPTYDELKEMHRKYSQGRNRVDLAEFITMVGPSVGQSFNCQTFLSVGDRGDQWL